MDIFRIGQLQKETERQANIDNYLEIATKQAQKYNLNQEIIEKLENEKQHTIQEINKLHDEVKDDLITNLDTKIQKINTKKKRVYQLNREITGLEFSQILLDDKNFFAQVANKII